MMWYPVVKHTLSDVTVKEAKLTPQGARCYDGSLTPRTWTTPKPTFGPLVWWSIVISAILWSLFIVNGYVFADVPYGYREPPSYPHMVNHPPGARTEFPVELTTWDGTHWALMTHWEKEWYLVGMMTNTYVWAKSLQTEQSSMVRYIVSYFASLTSVPSQEVLVRLDAYYASGRNNHVPIWQSAYIVVQQQGGR